MSRRNQFRARRGSKFNDFEQLAKLNKSLSNKKSRLKREFGIEVNIERKKLEDFDSREEFNKWKKEVKQFTDYKNYRFVKNDEGLVVSRDLVKEIERTERQVNRQKERDWNKIKNLPYKDPEGRTIHEVQSQRRMGDPKFNRFKPFHFNFDRFNSEKELKDYLERLKGNNAPMGYTERDKLMKENYLKSLENVFNLSGDPGKVKLDPRVKDIYKHVKNMSMDDFLQHFYSQSLVDFSFNYSREEENMKISELESGFGIG